MVMSVRMIAELPLSHTAAVVVAHRLTPAAQIDLPGRNIGGPGVNRYTQRPEYQDAGKYVVILREGPDCA